MILKELYPFFWGCVPSNLKNWPHMFCAGRTGPKEKVLVSAQGFKMEKKWLYLVLELYLIIMKFKRVREQRTQQERLWLGLHQQLACPARSRHRELVPSSSFQLQDPVPCAPGPGRGVNRSPVERG